MEVSLELIGKRLLLLLDDGRSANGSEPEQAAWTRDWLRGIVRAVSVIGLQVPEVSGVEATTTTTAAGLTVSVYIREVPAGLNAPPMETWHVRHRLGGPLTHFDSFSTTGVGTFVGS